MHVCMYVFVHIYIYDQVYVAGNCSFITTTTGVLSKALFLLQMTSLPKARIHQTGKENVPLDEVKKNKKNCIKDHLHGCRVGKQSIKAH